MKRKVIALLIVLVMTLGLAACGGSGTNSSPSSSSSPSSGSSPAGGSPSSAPSGKKVEISVAFGAMANGLDPISEDVNTTISICNHFYDRLLELDGDLNLNPAVAKSWKQVSDTSYEFEINLDYKFSNGDPLTMDDVIYSIERLSTIPKSADTGNRIDSVTADGNTLTITLKQHDNSIIYNIIGFSHIVNKAYITANGDDAIYLHPIGTGPYKVTEFTPGTSVTLETWDGYPFQKPQIDIIHITAIADSANRYIAVETGQLQYAGLVTAMEIPLAEKNPDLATLQVESNMIIPLAFNCEKAPFNDVNVRRGIVSAIDFKGLLALNGGREGIGSVLFAGFKDVYVDSPNFPEYNLDTAKQLLSAAGYTPDNPLTMETIYFRPDPGIEFIQSSLKSVGVNLVPNQLEFSVFLQQEAAGEYDADWTSNPNRGGHWLPDLDRLDYDNYLGQRNLCRWRNQRVQDLIAELRTTTDQAVIKADTYEINGIIGQEVPIVALYLQPILSVFTKNLTGVTILPNLQQSFRNAVYTG